MSNPIHMDEPGDDGRHPEYKHLVMAEVESHHGSLILTIKGHEGNKLISWDDWYEMVNDDDQADMEFAYVVDEYVDILEK